MTPPSTHTHARIQDNEADVNIGPLKLHLKGMVAKSAPLILMLMVLMAVGGFCWMIQGRMERLETKMDKVIDILIARNERHR